MATLLIPAVNSLVLSLNYNLAFSLNYNLALILGCGIIEQEGTNCSPLVPVVFKFSHETLGVYLLF